jgi:phosphopantothenate-cysteine ligase
MAVSDFTPQAVLTLDDMVDNVIKVLNEPGTSRDELAGSIRNAILSSGKSLDNKKINSRASDIALLLTQTPKVIGRIKPIQPDTILVGFKLLSGVSEDELLNAGHQLLIQNSCDFVLANDLENIEGDSHKAILIDKNGILGRANTKQDIAGIIYKHISERIAG